MKVIDEVLSSDFHLSLKPVVLEEWEPKDKERQNQDDELNFITEDETELCEGTRRRTMQRVLFRLVKDIYVVFEGET